MASEISVESVCQFIIAHGGKVKNTVLVSNFKKSLNNAATRDEARQKFKECVNTVAVVKTENGDKYVQLKKKYRPPSLSSSVSSVNSEVSTEVSTNTSMDQAPPITSFPSYGESDNESNTSFTPKGEVPYADAGSDDLVRSPRNPDTYPTTDFPVHEARPAEPTPVETYDNVISASKPPKSDAPPASKTKAERKSSPKKQASKPQISAPKSVASEDMIEDGPPKRLTPISKVTEEKVTKVDKGPPAQSRPPASKPESGEFAVPSAPRRKKTKDKKENVPPSPSLEHRVPSSIDRTKAGLQALATEQGRISRNRPISLMQTSYAGSVERARLNFQNKQRQNEDTTSLALSERSVDSKGEAEEDQERGSAPICLDPNDKLWIIKSAQANMVEMRKLLDLDPTLAEKRDFVMYTALHWAAKKGNIDMVNMLLDQKIDVNARSNGGYTPLHLAAIHGHEHIISHLLEYEADPTIRDYSGRQAIHYLKSLSLPLQRLLFGNEGSQTSKDFAAGLRPRLDSVRRNSERLSIAISGGFGSVGALVTKSAEDLSKPPDGSPNTGRRPSASKDGKKMSKKKSRKNKNERPSISIVSFDDSGYAGSLSSKSSSMTSIALSASSPNLNRSSAPATPNSQRRKDDVRTRSHTDY